jgi:hypothetical protein
MVMKGSCSCNNIEIIWHVIDRSLIPRACQCDYCVSKSAAYVGKSGTRFEVVIHNESLHKTIRHGSGSALFHECANCKQLVFVTWEKADELFGVLNSVHMNNTQGFSTPLDVDFSSQTVEEKQDRWQKNWCNPVIIKRQL